MKWSCCFHDPRLSVGSIFFNLHQLDLVLTEVADKIPKEDLHTIFFESALVIVWTLESDGDHGPWSFWYNAIKSHIFDITGVVGVGAFEIGCAWSSASLVGATGCLHCAAGVACIGWAVCLPLLSSLQLLCYGTSSMSDQSGGLSPIAVVIVVISH